MSFNTARIVGAINLFIAALLACLRYFISIPEAASKTMLIVAIICVFIWLIVTVIWCRCPNCHRVISQGAFLKSECPYCKMPLDQKKQDE